MALTSSYGGADVDNYTITDQTSTFASITPKALTISGIIALDKVYDGGRSAALELGDVLYDGLLNGDVVTVSTTGEFADKNVGIAKQVSLTSSYGGADLANYTITDQTGTFASITRLNSVNWIGGASGNWFDPSNWAGGAVPDLANVARVVLPDGVAADFAVAGAQDDANAAQPVQIDALEGGELRLFDGILTVGPGGLVRTRLTQTGGAITSAGLVDLVGLAQSGGTISALGDFTVRTSFSQNEAGLLSIGGSLAITDTSGGIALGALTVRGSTRIVSLGGDVVQNAGTVLKLGNGLGLEASNGATDFAVVLDAASNELGSAVAIDRAGRLALGSSQSITLSAKRISGAATVSSAAGIDAVIESTGDVILTTANRANIHFAGSTGSLSVISDGEVLFARSVVAGDLAVAAYGNVTETDPGALTVNGRAVAQSSAGRVDLRALLNGDALNATVRPVAEVIASSGLAGALRTRASTSLPALAPIAAPGLVQLPAVITGPTTVALTAGGAVVTAVGSGVRVSFADASDAPRVAGTRALTVTPLGNSTSMTLTVGEEAGAYLVEAGAAPTAGRLSSHQASTDIESLLADALEMVVQEDGMEGARFAVAVKGQTMVLIARNPRALSLAEKSANTLVGLGLAELRQKLQLGLEAISEVILVGENT